MSFNPKQFRYLIGNELERLDPLLASDNAVELLMLTAAQESHLGTYLWQLSSSEGIPGTLAYGVFQMEEAAYNEGCKRISRYTPDFNPPPRGRLITDLRLGIWTARCYYLMFSEEFPHWTEVGKMAEYWKKYWNTEYGAGTVKEAVGNYFEFVKKD